MSLHMTRAAAKRLGITLPGTPGKLGSRGVDDNQGRDRLFDAACKAHGLPPPVHEYAWHPTRRWRFDYLFDAHIAVERVGGVWVRGHHSRGKDQIDDMARRNEAQLLGYMVLEFTPQQIESGEAFVVIKRALDGKEEIT